MDTNKKQAIKTSRSATESSQSTDSNLESFTCLWLDQNVNSTEENRETQQELRQIINHLRTFDNAVECEQYIRQITQEKIVLIVSGTLGRHIVPLLHNLPQFSACYVFCQDRDANKPWASKYPKINGIFVRRSELLAQISKDQISRLKLEGEPSISILSHGSQAIESRNAIFMWFQLFIEVLLRMQHKSDDRKELIDICKNNYNGNNEQMEIINEFEKDYTAEKAIWWYTRESCFYRILNKALRIQDFDILFAFRFFITDIAKLIMKEHEKFISKDDNQNIVKVYRGQMVRYDEFELMKKSIGEFLSMNSFLSTSCNQFTALQFAQNPMVNCDNMQPILFEIKMNPSLKTKPFTNITEMSFFKGENEILIMLGAIFRIEEVIHDEISQIWVARLSLASEDNYQLKEIYSHMKEKIGDDVNLDSLGKLLLRMGENERAQKCYERMLDETMLAVGDAQLGLGWAHLRRNNYEESLEHFEEVLQIREHVLGEDHASVGEAYSFLGEVHIANEDYEQALIDLNKAITIQQKTLSSDSLSLAATYDSLANTYTLMKKYELALQYYTKVHKIRQAKLPPNHPQIAAIYKNLGFMYECKQNYSEALNYYQKSLEISRKSLPPTHHHIVEAENKVRKLKSKV